MKKLLLTLFSTLPFTIFAQVIFSAIPLDSAMVPRNLITNKGTLNVQGLVNNNGTPYDSVCLKIYRNYLPFDSIFEPLSYSNHLAPFNFTYQIKSELKEYALKVYGIKNKLQTFDTVINGLLAGDAYIIDGQSNALAGMRDNGSANGNKSEYIRVFGNSDSSTAGLVANLKWFRGEGDGFFLENGHAGQWGIRLARLLMDTMQIPIAIFNNGCGGTPITYYMRPANYKTDSNSNYGRLYYRVNKTGFKNSVRALLWSQGETDAYDNTTTATYVREFDTLEKSWVQDFPAMQKTYIFQTRNGGMPSYPFVNLQEIKEAQRQVAVHNANNVEIMSTSALRQDSGDLHFDYLGGYQKFGDRAFNLISRDIYSIPAVREIDASMIKSAYFTDSTTFVVLESADSLEEHNPGTPIQSFEVENVRVGTNIDSIYLNKNKIYFKLSKFPGDSITVSFLAQPKDSGNWVTNTNNIEIVSFYKYPVADSINGATGTGQNPVVYAMLKVYPNPNNGKFTLELDGVIPDGETKMEVYNIMGERIYSTLLTNARTEIDLSNNAKGTYIYRVLNVDRGMNYAGRLIMQ